MEESRHKKTEVQKATELKTFPVSLPIGEIKENFSLSTHSIIKGSKEQILNQAIIFHSKGNISEAKKYYKYCIQKGCNDPKCFSNYGVILGLFRDVFKYAP